MSLKQQFILALDCGSTNFKAAVFDARLRRLGEHCEPLPYLARPAGCVEFDPESAWRVSMRLIRKSCAGAGLDAGALCRIALTSQANTFCALDAFGRPLMSFMSWQDQRASWEAKWLNRRMGAGFHHHCSWPRVIAGLQAAMLLRLKKHCPALLKKTDSFVNLPGYLAGRLGFPNVVDVNLAAMSGLYSLKNRAWWASMLQVCGIEKRQMPGLASLGMALGMAAPGRDLVLARGTKVVFAGNDQTAGAFANFCSQKKIVVTLGTALVVYRVMGRRCGPYTADGCWGPYPGGKYYELATRNCCCVALDWARARLAPGRNIQYFTALAKQALAKRKEAANLGPEAWFYPDAMNTERAWAVSMGTGARALAVFEGIGFALKQLVEDDLGLAAPMPEIIVTGGGSANVFWLQLLADILDARVTSGAGDALLGAARMACPRAVLPAVSGRTTFLPRNARAYKNIYERWKKCNGRENEKA